MLYQKPKIEIVKFETEDVICASVSGNQDIDNPGDYSEQDGVDW